MNTILVGCESSGSVRDAFRELGYEAWSCDLLASEGKPFGYWYPYLYPKGHQLHDKQPHHQHDLFLLFNGGLAQSMKLEGQQPHWDLGIFHPPCTHLAGSGARWLTDHWVKKKSAPDGRYWHDGSAKRAAQIEAVQFVKNIWELPIERIAIENPVGMLPKLWRPWTQLIQPWMFGHFESKATCLWLKNLPPLIPTYKIAEECREALDLPAGSKPDQNVWRMPPSEDRWKLRSATYPGIAAAMAEQWSAVLNQPLPSEEAR